MYEEFARLLKNTAEAEARLFVKPSNSPDNVQPYVDLSNNPNDQVPADPNKPQPIEARLINMANKINNIDLQQQVLAQKMTAFEENLNSLAAAFSSKRPPGSGTW